MGRRKVKYQWDGESIRALRKYLGLTQQQMSEELGTRQQTISEWETEMYCPRGGMNQLLTFVAERVGYWSVVGELRSKEKEEEKEKEKEEEESES